jgi:predicted transcriptional regulator
MKSNRDNLNKGNSLYFSQIDENNVNNQDEAKIDDIVSSNISKAKEIDKINILENNNQKLEKLEIFENVKIILTSMMRTKLLICLFPEKRDLKYLREELGKPSTSILHGIKELDKLNLIKKEGKQYGLSSNGTILAINVLRLVENLNSINNNFDFWKYHSIGDIPYESLKRIHLLQNARSISSTEEDLAKTSNEYLNLFSKSKDVKLLLPIFSSIHLKSILSCLNRGGNLELIVTENILDFIKIKGYGDKFLSFIELNESKLNESNDHSFKDSHDLKNQNNGILKIWKFKNNFKLFLSSCDNFLSLSSFSDDGYYDNSTMLLDKTNNGISWGIEIFEHYKKYSQQVDIKEYFQ